MKKNTIITLIILSIFMFVSCNKADKIVTEEVKPKDEYNYSMIEIHPNISAGSEVPYSVDFLAKRGFALIEFVVTSEPEDITYDYYAEYLVDAAIEHNYSEDALEAVKKEATKTITNSKVSIKINNVIHEGNYNDVNSYDEIWLLGDASLYKESFVPDARFIAFAEVNLEGKTPVELFINDYIFYIDKNENIIPFTDDPSLMQYKDYSVEKMADLTVEAAAAIKADAEEK